VHRPLGEQRQHGGADVAAPGTAAAVPTSAAARAERTRTAEPAGPAEAAWTERSGPTERRVPARVLVRMRPPPAAVCRVHLNAPLVVDEETIYRDRRKCN